MGSDFREVFERERKRQRVSKTEIASRASISSAAVSKALREGANPTNATMQKFCDAIGCDLVIEVRPRVMSDAPDPDLMAGC